MQVLVKKSDISASRIQICAKKKYLICVLIILLLTRFSITSFSFCGLVCAAASIPHPPTGKLPHASCTTCRSDFWLHKIQTNRPQPSNVPSDTCSLEHTPAVKTVSLSQLFAYQFVPFWSPGEELNFIRNVGVQKCSAVTQKKQKTNKLWYPEIIKYSLTKKSGESALRV